jgi:hypothetical protein
MAGATLSHAEARPIIIEAWRSLWGRDPTEREVGPLRRRSPSLESGYGRAGQFAQHAARGRYDRGGP